MVHRIVGREEVMELTGHGLLLQILKFKNNDRRGIGESNSLEGMRGLALGVFERLQHGEGSCSYHLEE